MGFSAIKKHAAEHGGRYLALTFALSNGAGIALSGIVFSLVGFYGSMLIGVITFLPIIFLYLYLFDESKDDATSQSIPWGTALLDSFRFLYRDRVLLKFGLTLGIFNVVGALFPAFLKLEINNSINHADYLTAPILAGGLFLATFFYKFLDTLSVS